MMPPAGRPKGLFPRLIRAAGGAVAASRQLSSDEVLDTEIGAMPLAFGTAHNLLKRAGVDVGTRVLVIFAGQPVGYAALRLAAIHGAKPFAVCPPSTCGLARAAGAQTVDAAAVFGMEPFDAVIDLLGGDGWRSNLRALKPGGRYATPGAIGEPPAPRETRQVFLNDVTAFDRPHRSRELFAGLVTVVTATHLRLMPTQTQ